MTTLELGLVGNGSVAALVNDRAEIVWACVPRLDGDPTFCTLLRERQPGTGEGFGYFAIDVEDFAVAEQEYVENTAVLVTRIRDSHGACVEVIDFAPRFERFGRMFCPMLFVRRLVPVSGRPRIRIRARPARNWGAVRREMTFGSHHVRYIGAEPVLRLTTNGSIAAISEEQAFVLDEPIALILGPDETVDGAAEAVAREWQESTAAHWREWVGALAIPFEWQDAVIRAAIALKMNAVEDTGAIVAAVTTSIPEAAGTGRNWDYRHCWLRDGYHVVNTLNRLGATRTMERFLTYIVNVASASENGRLQPVYGVSGGVRLDETIVETLPGYRGMGPVRIGNAAFAQAQHDVYGSAILAATHVFFDRRLATRGDAALFARLEALGDQAVRSFPEPDAGIWEFRSRAERHTYSCVMCWAACDRLARIAAHLGLMERQRAWGAHAETMRTEIEALAWNPRISSFASNLNGERIDASLLLLADLGFIGETDPRFAGTVAAVEKVLKRGGFTFRYADEDGFGIPQNAFTVCSFWYVNALAALGRREEARELFEALLSCRTRLGLLAEHIDPTTKEQWGNFAQTYSMVGLINAAIRLSIRWDQAF
jgi:GH15 family glucan-1,4-alpha-glucosidase